MNVCTTYQEWYQNGLCGKLSLCMQNGMPCHLIVSHTKGRLKA